MDQFICQIMNIITMFPVYKIVLIKIYNIMNMIILLPKVLVIILLIISLTKSSVSSADTCPIAQYFKFYTKQCLTEQQIIKNPYTKPSADYLNKVKDNLNNKDRVCALKYMDASKQTYQLKEFPLRSAAQSSGWIVTHQGVCGKCSTTRDLYVYLTQGLTKPVRSCGLKYFYSIPKLRNCILKLGFTKPCAEVWVWNTINTRQQCGAVCFWSYIRGRPYIINGELNKCLQCDEDISGPIFKYESGRTRRNSGIKSEIDRPSDQIYNLTHCYY